MVALATVAHLAIICSKDDLIEIMKAYLQPADAHGDPTLGHLQDRSRLLLTRVLQVVPVHRDDLVTLYQPAVKVGSSTLDHLGDEHSRTGLLANDGEAEAAVALLHQLDVHLLVDLVVLPVDDQAHSVRRLPQRVQGKAVSDTPQVLPHDLQ